MKRISSILAVLLSSISLALAQAPQSFSYQAVLRGSNGEVLANKDVTMRITLRSGSPEGDAQYAETHEGKTTASGVLAVAVGAGKSPSAEFTKVPWQDGIFMQVEISEGGSNFTNLGTTQILAVPYALYAQNAAEAGVALTATEATRASELSQTHPVVISPSANHPKDAPIFTVRNSAGEVVFEVYEDGVHSYVASSSRDGSKSGFVVADLGQPTNELLAVTTDSIRFYINSANDRSPRGGFAVAGRLGRASELPYLAVTSTSTEVYFDEEPNGGTRSPRGGFAVAGRLGREASSAEYLSVTPSSTQITIDETQHRSPRGGFAVAGRLGRADELPSLLHVSPDSTRIYINDGTRSPRGGFAVAGRLGRGLRASGRNYFEVTANNANITFGSSSTGQNDIGSFVVGDMQGNNYMVVNKDKATFNQIYSEGDLLVGGRASGARNYVGQPGANLSVTGQGDVPTTKLSSMTWTAADIKTAQLKNGNPLRTETHYLAGGNYIFYFWEAVKNDQLCPDGWHIATKADWEQLFELLDANKQADATETGVTNYTGFVELVLDPNGNWANKPAGMELTNTTGLSVCAGVVSYDTSNEMVIDNTAAKYWALDNGEPTMVTFNTQRARIHGAGSITVQNAKTDQVGTVRCVKNN